MFIIVSHPSVAARTQRSPAGVGARAGGGSRHGGRVTRRVDMDAVSRWVVTDMGPRPVEPPMAAVEGTLYTREDCTLCDEAVATLERVADEEGIDLELAVIDVDEDPDLRSEYGERVPYVLLEGRPAFKYQVEPGAARSTLRALAADAGD